VADSTPSERVAALADEFLDRHRRGDKPPVREYAEKYPELAEEIRQVFPAVALLENVAIEDSRPPRARRYRPGRWATSASCARSGAAAWASCTKPSR